MEIKYFVARAFRYKESGSWEYKIVGMYDDISAAKQAFHSNMGAIIKESNDLCMCIIYDSLGNLITSDFDNTVVEPNEDGEGEE